MELEKRLERVEKGMTGLWIGFAAGLAVAGLACVLSVVALCYRPAPGPGEQPVAEKPEQSEARRTSYLDELERLETLKAKGALTPQEFDAKKQQLLAAAPAPAPSKGGDVDELDKLLRDLNGLFNKNVINGSEYNTKKQQYLQRKITVTNLTRDLEKIQKLFNEGILNGSEYNALKQQVLAADSALGKK